MGFCTIAFPVVASRELSRQYILGRLREDTAEVGDIRPHTASMRGFTMKFDWHLTLVRFIMAGVSYYQIIEASNIIRSARRLVYAASRNLLRRTNTYCESRTMDDKTMRRNGSHDSWGFFFRSIEQYLFSWLGRTVSEHNIDGLKIFSGSVTGLAWCKNICINKFWDTEMSRENTDVWLIWVCTTLDETFIINSLCLELNNLWRFLMEFLRGQVTFRLFQTWQNKFCTNRIRNNIKLIMKFKINLLATAIGKTKMYYFIKRKKHWHCKHSPIVFQQIKNIHLRNSREKSLSQ